MVVWVVEYADTSSKETYYRSFRIYVEAVSLPSVKKEAYKQITGNEYSLGQRDIIFKSIIKFGEY